MLRHLYFEAIDEKFLKPTVLRVEADLRAFASIPTARTRRLSRKIRKQKKRIYLVVITTC